MQSTLGVTSKPLVSTLSLHCFSANEGALRGSGSPFCLVSAVFLYHLLFVYQRHVFLDTVT